MQGLLEIGPQAALAVYFASSIVSVGLSLSESLSLLVSLVSLVLLLLDTMAKFWRTRKTMARAVKRGAAYSKRRLSVSKEPRQIAPES
jgi:hypothetical protein